jgi:hypothetical protein
MKKLAFTLGLLIAISSVSPAFADDSANIRGGAAEQAAERFSPNSAGFIGQSEANVATNHTVALDKRPELQISFTQPNSNVKRLQIRPAYESESVSDSTNRSSSVATGGNRVFSATSGANYARLVAQSFTPTTTDAIVYDTNFGVGSYLVSLENIGLQILAQDGSYLGTLSTPWAFDSKGRNLKTWFTLDKSQLSQHISIDKQVSYPVTSDPNWSYTFDTMVNTTLGVGGLRVSYRSPAYVTNLLKACFNCYFPILGAPKTYPYVGQTMPLQIQLPILSFITKPAPVKVSAVYSYGWQFIALPGHVDWVGSAITFQWYADFNGRLHLSVVGSIANPNPCGFGTDDACRVTYPVIAGDSWAQLFNNVTN